MKNTKAVTIKPMLLGPLSPWYDTSLGCIWRRWPLFIWMVAANLLNKQFWTANNEWSSSFGVG